MKKPIKVVPKSASGALALGTAAPADPEVVAVARRRQFSPSEKRRILAAAERCITPGSKGALLRREGIYSSHLRALFRAFRKGAVLDCYYDYVRGDITRAEPFAHRSILEEARVAASEARGAELGPARLGRQAR